MRSKVGMKFDCILEEPLDFIDIDYTHLNKTIRYEQRPHGEWEWQTEDKYRCSACKANVRVEECMNEPQYDFCPKCGADMREGEAE